MEAVDFWVILLVAVSAVLFLYQTKGLAKWGAFFLVVTLLVDAFLTFRDIRAQYDGEEPFQKDICSNQSMVTQYHQIAEKCRESRLVTSEAFTRRMQLRMADQIGYVYYHLVLRWATDAYMQYAIPLLMLFLIYTVFQFLNRRYETDAQMATSRLQIDAVVTAQQQQTTMQKRLLDLVQEGRLGPSLGARAVQSLTPPTSPTVFDEE